MAYLIFRKGWRLLGLVFPILYILTSREITLFYTSVTLGIFLLGDLFRFLNSDFNHWLFIRFKLILKAEEKKRFLTTTTTFLISSLLTIIFFKKEVAIYSLSFLVIGDAASALIGTYVGRIKIKNKSLEGSLAFFITCLISAALLNKLSKLSLPLPVLLIGALTGAVVEVLPLPWDDNFTIGLSCGIVMTIILR